MSYIVYKHTFPNEKVYIGITSMTPARRWDKGRGYNSQPLMKRAISKYGWDNIAHEVLFDKLTKEEAEQKEIQLISEYKSNNKMFGYNIENGGNSIGKMTDEHRRFMSELAKKDVAIKIHSMEKNIQRKQKEKLVKVDLYAEGAFIQKSLK